MPIGLLLVREHFGRLFLVPAPSFAAGNLAIPRLAFLLISVAFHTNSRWFYVDDFDLLEGEGTTAMAVVPEPAGGARIALSASPAFPACLRSRLPDMSSFPSEDRRVPYKLSVYLSASHHSPVTTHQLQPPTRDTQTSRNARKLLKTNDRVPLYPRQISPRDDSPSLRPFASFSPAKGPTRPVLPFTSHESRVTSHKSRTTCRLPLPW